MVLRSRLPAPDWSANEDPEFEAKCRKHPLPTNHNVDDDAWFHDMEEAAAICNGTYDGRVCPFRDQCLHIGLVNNEQFGVFGGLLPVQRRWVRRENEEIPRDQWSQPEDWLHKVPSLEYFEQLGQADDEADDVEAEAN